VDAADDACVEHSYDRTDEEDCQLVSATPGWRRQWTTGPCLRWLLNFALN
jgi:hypothetical protein